MNNNLSQRLPQVSWTNLALEWLLGVVATQQRIRSRFFVVSSTGAVVVANVVVVLTITSVRLMVVPSFRWCSTRNGTLATISCVAKMPSTKPINSPLTVTKQKTNFLWQTLITFRSRLFVVIYNYEMGTKRWDIQWTTETCAIVYWLGSEVQRSSHAFRMSGTPPFFHLYRPQPRRNEKKWILFFKGNATFIKHF